MSRPDLARATLVTGSGSFGTLSKDGLGAVNSLGVTSQLGLFRNYFFRPLGAPTADQSSLTVWLCSAAKEGLRAVDSLGVAPQLGLFRHFCFRPLGVPAADLCVFFDNWLCFAANAVSDEA
jgi:hypothetical protein